MQFVYGKFAGEQKVSVPLADYAHVFKVRRVGVGSTLNWRNLKDETLYTYKVEEITKKEALLHLISTCKDENILPFRLHVGWCIVDPKTIEKNIAMLNEMGVVKISFVYAEFSQKNYKIDRAKLERILINSSEQCGRTSLMEIEVLESVDEYLKTYVKSCIIDFSDEILTQDATITNFLVGPEGGFSENERKLFKNRDIFGLKSQNILKSETAVVGVCAKLSL